MLLGVKRRDYHRPIIEWIPGPKAAKTVTYLDVESEHWRKKNPEKREKTKIKGEKVKSKHLLCKSVQVLMGLNSLTDLHV